MNNIVEVCNESPEMILDEIQSIIDSSDWDLPDEAATPSNVRRLQELQTYYSTQYAYLVGLWGAMKTATTRTDAPKIAIRDYLEKAVSACSKKYDAASRLLTGYQTIANEARGARTW